MRLPKKDSVKWIIIGLFASWALFTFMIFPILNMMKIILFPNGAFDTKPLVDIVKSDRVVRALLNSFISGIVIAITTNILGVFQILVLDYFEIKNRKLLNILYFSPLIINGMVLVLAYFFIIGSNGILTTALQNIFPNLKDDWMLGMPAVMLQLTFSNTMFHMTFVRDALKNLDFQTVEAAQNMGASSFNILRKVVLPTIIPSLLVATIMNFSMAMNAFASPKILGGGKFETISPLILTFSQTNTTKNYAVILTLFLGIVTFTVLSIFTKIENKVNVVSVSKVKTKIRRQKIQNSSVNFIVTLVAHLIAFIQVAPAALVVVFAFMDYESLITGNLNPKQFTLTNFKMVFSSIEGMWPVLVSISYAIVAAIFCSTIMLLLGRIITKYKSPYTKILENVLMIPWYVPATLIAIGFLFTFNSSQNPFVMGVVLTGTIYILLIAYIVLRTPTTLRVLKAAYLSQDNSLEEAARNLGANSFSTFRKVIFPILLPTFLSSILLSFNGLLAEFNATIFLFNPKFTTLGVAINNATRPESGRGAVMYSFVYSIIIMLIASLMVFMVYGVLNRKTKNK
ncbi:ABC transporter permease [Streptococcus halichoeri]|uniref:ABC transporter permease n=1 Tax=Streptococcus halichoeri TaxID=254785 RepID=UPI00135B0CDE|nr:iron ABC transporter permease [Streptococcus halichoeri]